ncbi:hypothetical protein BH765_gp54 [Gordonia phage Kvothe]|uniref:Uncharacterized protein n=1 Tax=Gordonia phage Kvothe TaxID=1838071 RepID=A0A166Y7L1_9CAUD|nr:hypothetical protein BH765_gp54 [Gordonia phage Kvothe]ANA86163.1 hypothetical protein PBI_KVOTHE_54 [Gordonia phage Kvothe]
MTDLPTENCDPQAHAREGGCYQCCDRCDYDLHRCPGCGSPTTHDGKLFSPDEWHERVCKEGDGDKRVRKQAMPVAPHPSG